MGLWQPAAICGYLRCALTWGCDPVPPAIASTPSRTMVSIVRPALLRWRSPTWVCGAGMGRAPAVALAYMWWVHGLPLDPTYAELREKRCCSPSLSAVRQAATDMLYGGSPQQVVVRKKGTSGSEEVLVAGVVFRLCFSGAAFRMWYLGTRPARSDAAAHAALRSPAVLRAAVLNGV